MYYQRTNFPLIVFGGQAKGDTGFLVGALEQLRWSPAANDTGQVGTLSLAVVPEAGDTGSGWEFYGETRNFGAGFTRAPRQPQHGFDGAPDPADTGRRSAFRLLVGLTGCASS